MNLLDIFQAFKNRGGTRSPPPPPPGIAAYECIKQTAGSNISKSFFYILSFGGGIMKRLSDYPEISGH